MSDFRPGALNGMKTWEGEAQRRLNPYGPARPPTPEPETRRHIVRRLWSRLLAWLHLKKEQGDGAQGN